MYSTAYLNKYIEYCKHLSTYANTVQPVMFTLLLIALVVIFLIVVSKYNKYQSYHNRKTTNIANLLLIGILVTLFIDIVAGTGDIAPSMATATAQYPVQIAQQDKFINGNKYRLCHYRKMEVEYDAFYKYDIKHPHSNLAKHHGINYWINKHDQLHKRVRGLQMVDEKGHDDPGMVGLGLTKEQRNQLTDKSGYHKLPKIAWNNNHFPYSRIGYVF